MATPSTKSPEMETMLESLFGRTTAIQSDTCAFCHKPATAFRDDLSRREYAISGMCQECQDDFFGDGS